MAASEKVEKAGNDQYQGNHMSQIFQQGFSFSGFERDYLGLNVRGEKYVNISGVSGVDSLSDGRGAVFADFDNDGDTDIFLTTLQREAHYLFRNNVGQKNNFIRVALEGTKSGRDAFGAVVRVKTSAGILTKVKSGGSGFLSQSDPRLVFGLGKDETAEWVTVTWPGSGPGGKTQTLTQVAAGSSLTLTEGEDALWMMVKEKRFQLVDPLTGEEMLYAKLRFRKGEAFPDLKLETLDQKSLKLKDLVRPGRRAFVNLWATYCIPCREEMPELEHLRPQFEAAKIDLVGISIDLETRDRIPQFLKELGVTYSIYTTEETTVEKIFSGDEVNIPMSFLLDEHGNVLKVFSGWSRESREQIQKLVEAKIEVAATEQPAAQ